MHSETFRFTCVCSRASPTWPRKAISPKKNTRVARTYAYKRRLKNDEGKDIYIYIYIREILQGISVVERRRCVYIQIQIDRQLITGMYQCGNARGINCRFVISIRVKVTKARNEKKRLFERSRALCARNSCVLNHTFPRNININGNRFLHSARFM